MARETGKRAQAPRRTAERSSTSSPKASTAKPRARGPVAERAPASRRGAPESESERAPGRGKYDRSRSPDEREKEQLKRLLEAAGHVFSEVGWADATVEAIVSRAGMSRRTFYEHFDDLKACLLVLQQRISKFSFRAVETQVSMQTDPPSMLRVGVTAFLGGIAMFPHMARVIFRVVRSAGPEFEVIHEQMLARFAKLVLDGVQRSIELGTAKKPADGVVELRVFALVSGMEAIAMRYVLRGEEAKALEAAPVLIDMVQKTFA